MYAPYFGLAREPFSLAPDPRFLFMSERHREALAHLLYGVGGGGGFVLLTGEIGAGKTTVARCFLEQLPPHCVVAYIFNPCLSVIELLQTVCSEFGIAALPPGASVKTHVDALNRYLLDAHAQGKHALLVIDEAQALDPPVLEQLRLLTNLETSERKLLQIVLIGQPELRDMLAQPGLEQLAQRVIARYHLGPLTAAETRLYVEHRLAVAGLKQALPFDAAALAALHRRSAGVPRRINLLADRSLLGAYGRSRQQVDRGMVEQAAREVFGQPDGRADGRTGGRGRGRHPQPAVWAALALTGLLVGLLIGVAAVGWLRPTPPAFAAQPPPAASTAASTAASSATPTAASMAATATPSATVASDVTESAVARSAAGTAELLAAALADEAQAWRELALYWQVAIGDGEPCLAALQAQLSCYRQAGGGLQLLRQLDRPVLLALRPNGGPRVQVLLLGLDPASAVLQAGTRRVQLPLSELALLWRGDFATLVRTPTGWRAGSEPSPAARSWLQDRLAQALPGRPSQSWADRVAAFQVLHGLPADGQVGPLTLMQLNRSTGVVEPRLAAAPER